MQSAFNQTVVHKFIASLICPAVHTFNICIKQLHDILYLF